MPNTQYETPNILIRYQQLNVLLPGAAVVSTLNCHAYIFFYFQKHDYKEYWSHLTNLELCHLIH